MRKSFSAMLLLGRLSLLLSLFGAVRAEGLRRASGTARTPKLISFPLIPGDSPEARRRRRHRRRQLEANENNNPLKVQRDALYLGYGTHYVDLWVGCPPQRVTVIVDTGSSTTAFPCSGCHRCGGDADSSDQHIQYHTDALFRFNESSCFRTVTAGSDCLVGSWNWGESVCRSSKHYSEGSTWDAVEAVDQVYTGGDHDQVDLTRREKDSFQLHFGCQDTVTGLFETQLADGIMGMYNNPASFWSQAYDKKAIEKKMFSLCFSEPGQVERTGTPAGAMVLGGTDTRLHRTPMVYAQQTNDDGKYVLHLEKVYLLSPSASGEAAAPVEERAAQDFQKIQIFEEDLNNGGGGIILDSGTTATFLTTQLARRFVDVFHSMVSEDIMVLGAKKNHALTQRQIQQLPVIVFQMKAWMPAGGEDADVATTRVPGMVGADLDPRHAGKSILVSMPPLNYLTRGEDDDQILDPTDMDEVSHYKFNIAFSKTKGKGGVLGANFMKGLDILFDMENKRIGFAKSDCEYSILADEEEAG